MEHVRFYAGERFVAPTARVVPIRYATSASRITSVASIVKSNESNVQLGRRIVPFEAACGGMVFSATFLLNEGSCAAGVSDVVSIKHVVMYDGNHPKQLKKLLSFSNSVLCRMSSLSRIWSRFDK